MVNKYVKTLESRAWNDRTNSVWSIDDVPALWRNKVREKILSDGYHFAADGTVYPNEGGGN